MPSARVELDEQKLHETAFARTECMHHILFRWMPGPRDTRRAMESEMMRM
jgi:hypothetical protein